MVNTDNSAGSVRIALHCCGRDAVMSLRGEWRGLFDRYVALLSDDSFDDIDGEVAECVAIFLFTGVAELGETVDVLVRFESVREFFIYLLPDWRGDSAGGIVDELVGCDTSGLPVEWVARLVSSSLQ